MFPYILTRGGISITLDGRTVSIASDEPEFNDIVDALRVQNWTAVKRLTASRAERLERAAIKTNGLIKVQHGTVTYNPPNGPSIDVHGTIAERMLELVAMNFDLSPICRFYENLMRNPSHRAVNSLYDFLEYGNMPLTADGCFIAYKAVRGDFRDIHSGTYDNSVGAICKMPRNQVDENPDRTCSAGLHVCSYEYLPHFAHANGKIVAVKVNPADVVAIPADYNNTKMRVSQYEVISEVTNWYRDNADILARSSTYGDGFAVLTYEEDDSDDDYDDNSRTVDDDYDDSYTDDGDGNRW